MRSVPRVVFATLAFAAVHSLLASRPAKRLAARTVGVRARDAWYRPLYNVHALASAAWWVRTVVKSPDRELWRAPPALAALMVAGQLAGAVWMARAAATVGLAQLLGIPGARAWLQGQPVPLPQEAQGPAASPHAMDVRGPFLRSRHPLNVAPLPVLWLQPVMTRNRLLATALATAYLVAGSRHEEHRLALAYGDRYERYRRGGARFLV